MSAFSQHACSHDARARLQGRRCSLALAGFPPDATYRECVRLVSATVITRASFEAEQRRDVTAMQQSVRGGGPSFALPFHHGDKLAFARSAERLPHPAQVRPCDLPRDLCEAIAFTVARQGSIVQFRERQVELLRDVAKRLEPLNRYMARTLSDAAASVVGRYHFALVACLIDSTRHPDVFFVRRLMRGFHGYGTLPSAGVYTTGGVGPTLPVDKVFGAGHSAWNEYLAASIAARGSVSDRDCSSDSYKAAAAAFDATIKECNEGWCVGAWDHGTASYRGFTWDEIDSHEWLRGPHSWRGVRRFAVFQKEK